MARAQCEKQAAEAAGAPLPLPPTTADGRDPMSIAEPGAPPITEEEKRRQEAERAPYVFPACGHVHAYSKELRSGAWHVPLQYMHMYTVR